MNKVDYKVGLLTLIRDEREVLFGRFSSIITNEVKEAKWKEVVSKAHTLGLVPMDKDSKYVRDTTWQNWRKRAVEKRNNSRKIGKRGGKRLKYDEADLLIFEIIGQDSPALDGLAVAESSGTNGSADLAEPMVKSSFAEIENEVIENLSGTEDTYVTPLCSGAKANLRGSRLSVELNQGEKRMKGINFCEKELINLKKSKIEKQEFLLDTQIEIAKKDSYLKDLEIYKMEQELHLPPSEYTKKFYEFQAKTEII